MSTTDHTAERNASYELAERVRTGQQLVARRTIERYSEGHEEYLRIEAGEVVHLASVSNAGFNGQVASVRTLRGRMAHGVSLGALTDDLSYRVGQPLALGPRQTKRATGEAEHVWLWAKQAELALEEGNVERALELLDTTVRNAQALREYIAKAAR